MRKVFLFVVIIIIFIVRFISYEYNHASHIPDDWFDGKMTITGIITEDPDHGLDKTKITLGDLGILATTQNGTLVSYGDKVSIIGTITHPENFMTDTDREFDYINYLKVHDIYGLMKVSNIEVVSHHNRSLFLEKLFMIKHTLVNTIRDLFPKSEAGLLAGIIIGEKSLLPKDTLSDFQIAGLTHMIVLSGYNITIITTSIITLLAYMGFGYRGRRVGAMIIIPVFLIMTGLGASSVRAGIMSLIMLLLQITTRPAHNLRIILYTAGTMVFINPRILLHDPSFHMSFLAFVGLVYVTPILEKKFKFRNLIIETISVQIFVLPYIIWMNGRVSLLLLISNILTVPLVPVIMGAGFVVVMIGMVLYPLGAMLVPPIKLGLSYIIWIAHWVASVETMTFVIPPFGVWVMLGIYGVIMAYLLWWNRKRKSKERKYFITNRKLFEAVEFFLIIKQKGFIKNPNETISISNAVQITKKALKHLVDSRIQEGISKRDIYELITRSLEVVEKPQLYIKNPNQKKYPNSYLLGSYYPDIEKAVVVILDNENSKKSVVTIYFKKKSDFDKLLKNKTLISLVEGRRTPHK